MITRTPSITSNRTAMIYQADRSRALSRGPENTHSIVPTGHRTKFGGFGSPSLSSSPAALEINRTIRTYNKMKYSATRDLLYCYDDDDDDDEALFDSVVTKSIIGMIIGGGSLVCFVKGPPIASTILVLIGAAAVGLLIFVRMDKYMYGRAMEFRCHDEFCRPKPGRVIFEGISKDRWREIRRFPTDFGCALYSAGAGRRLEFKSLEEDSQLLTDIATRKNRIQPANLKNKLQSVDATGHLLELISRTGHYLTSNLPLAPLAGTIFLANYLNQTGRADASHILYAAAQEYYLEKNKALLKAYLQPLVQMVRSTTRNSDEDYAVATIIDFNTASIMVKEITASREAIGKGKNNLQNIALNIEAGEARTRLERAKELVANTHNETLKTLMNATLSDAIMNHQTLVMGSQTLLCGPTTPMASLKTI